ncbi:hypothetical protein [[Kitasatospora] papulosa]|uniref:hypothetical protein n=1 Tax=[Kitasatospora] papulosa TaxID=1464011 RepID=UPI0036B7CD03
MLRSGHRVRRCGQRWHKRHRIAENIDIFDSELTADELKGGLDGLEAGRRGGPEPKAVIFADFGRAIPEA